jgi:3-methyladenine DNA glycosylase AlkC
MTEKVLLKDLLFNQNKVNKIATSIHKVYPEFPQEDFVIDAITSFKTLELKARISYLAVSFQKHLPQDYPTALAILLKSLPEPSNPNLTDNDFGDFIYAPYADFVAKYGCQKKYLNLSLDALAQITTRFSAEDAIRYFINAFPKETMLKLLSWTTDAHYHLRRLCSEGTRPKLPWSPKIQISPEAALPILDQLFYDKTRFVTRSVANHLNDIAKTNPDLVIETLQKWQKSGRQDSQEMNFIIRHALRTLIKKGHPKALSLLGFKHGAKIKLTELQVPESIALNAKLNFSFTISATENLPVLIDYILHFQNKSGKLANKKVFKLKQLNLSKNKPAQLTKSHFFKEKMTTRTIYPGLHKVEVQANGKVIASKTFMVTKK